MTIKLKTGLLLLFFTLFCVGLYSQSPRFNSYKILKNKKSVEVNTIFQDQRGYLWLGTNYGLVRYDGVEFELFTEKDSLAENHVTSLGQDNSGTLWIGHESGKISVYKHGQFSEFKPEEGLSTKEISSFFIDDHDVVWFSTFGEGVYYYSGINRKRLYILDTDNGLLDNYVYDIVECDSSRLYFATDKGISVYDTDKKEFIDQITTADRLPDNIVKDLIIRKNFLWIAMEDGGICKYDLNKRQFSHISPWESGSINNIAYISDNEIWASTKRKGIVKIVYDEKQNAWYTMYGKNNDLPDVRTNVIYKDRENNIWIGSLNGLSVRKNNNIEFLDEKDGFNIKNIFSFVIDDFGNYWIASQEGLFIASKDKMGEIKERQLFDKQDEFYSFISLYKDYNGNIWAGTYGYGVFIIDPATLKVKHYNTNKGLSNDNIIHISGDSNSIWLSTLGGGITKYCMTDTDSSRNYTTKDGLTSDYVYSTFKDSKQRIWIATDGGGAVYLLNDTIYHVPDEGLDTTLKTVYTIIEDRNNDIWFNSANNGLYRYDGKYYYNYNEENGLKSNQVQGLTTDRVGNPVIISYESIDKFIPGQKLFEYHGENDGLVNMEPNLNSLFKDKNNNIWIGTVEGIVELNSGINDTLEALPEIFITRKSVFLNPVSDDIHSFKHNKNHLTFYYTGLWFKSSENLTYRYKLEGYDIVWNAPTSLRLATYSNLPPGNYKFVVEVNYSGGNWIGSPDAEFSFKIRKPFWKTTVFIIALILVLVISIYAFIKARIRNLERAKEVLENEVKKRTAEIQHQKEKIEAQRDEIELQNNNITSSIEYASRIQKALLPSHDSFATLIGEHFIFFRPRDIVSGDFYYLNVKGDDIIVAAADCTGHGVPGAFMSILGISLLNQLVHNLKQTFDAGEILTTLREEIKTALQQTGKFDEAKDGMDISLCVLNKKKKIVNYAGAYNPLIFIRDNTLIKYDANKMPIGIFLKDEVPFTNHAIQIKKGDCLYMYSDGYQDQFGGKEKKKFLSKNLNNLLLKISVEPFDKQIKILEETFESWKGAEAQVDDIIVLGFKI